MKVSTSSIRKLIDMGINPDRKDFADLAAQLDIMEMQEKNGLRAHPLQRPSRPSTAASASLLPAL